MNPIAKLGPYIIFEKLGEGGLAKVFLARDSNPNSKGPFIALKCLNKEAAHHELTSEGFFNEIKLLEVLRHPNLLAGKGSGAERDIHYSITEFIDGQDLRSVNSRIQKGASILNLIPFIISEVLTGVNYLHSFQSSSGKLRNILHNDLTPGNIFISYEGKVKIIDFGAATFKGQKRLASNDDSVLGTLSYLAPEKLLGKTPDYRADLYAVGVLLYELTFGSPPFRHKKGENDMDVLNRIVAGRYQPFKSFNKEAPQQLLDTIEKAMQLKPKHRFKNAMEMALSLGIDLHVKNDPEAQKRRRFLLGSAIQSLFTKEYAATAHRR